MFGASNSSRRERPGNTYHHVHAKLLRLHENMNTGTGWEIAAGRHAFLQDFVKRFEAEWYGKDWTDAKSEVLRSIPRNRRAGSNRYSTPQSTWELTEDCRTCPRFPGEGYSPVWEPQQL